MAREYHLDGSPSVVREEACARALRDLADAVAAMSSA
jgi:hypothetical protein